MPVIDVDCHVVEFLPALVDVLREHGERSLADRVADRFAVREATTGPTPSEGRFMGGWHGVRTDDARERAAAFAPALLAERLEELGIDVALVHTSLGLSLGALHGAAERVAMARALNSYVWQITAGLRARVLPSALIPMAAPSEAVAVVREAAQLGFRCATIEAPVWYYPPSGVAVDGLGGESYDPVWHECLMLGITPLFHSSGMGWAGRAGKDNFVFNHIGAFAAGSEFVLRSMLMGGVLRRHPGMRWGFLEGGFLWLLELLRGFDEHWELRSPQGLARLDPSRLDVGTVRDLLAESAPELIRPRLAELDQALVLLRGAVPPPEKRDDFSATRGTGEAPTAQQLSDVIYVGQGWDLPALRLLPAVAETSGLSLGCMYGSDFGHWDASPTMTAEQLRTELSDVVPQTLVDDYLWRNAAAFLTAVNPGFFDGTVLARRL